VRLDGPGVVLLAAVAAVGAATAVALCWDRANRWGRIGAVVASVLAFAVTAALQLNRMVEAYPSWSALAGVTAEQPDSAPAAVAAAAAPPRAARAGGGTLISVRVEGRASRLNLPMYVYLPPGYERDRRMRFPVIEAAHGYPGSPRTWIRRLNIRDYLDREIATGRMAPTVVLLPYQTPQQLRDTECTNLVGGPQAETFLTRDVPAYARAHLRVRTDRAGWGLVGYSAGGFCATNLLLRHPGEYEAAASLSGYTGPGIAVGDHSESTTNDDGWRLAHLPQPPAALYLAWANDDPPARRAGLRLAGLAHPPLTVTTAVVARGGHSDAAWEAMEGPAFDWLSADLDRPVAG
jgi:enterochelin esterase-like enzyme